MFIDDTVNATHKNLNLVEVISKIVLLKPSRKALKGKCPFHKDETTSLMVSPERNSFKCFGCGAEGGPVEFLMAIDGKTRSEVISEVAKQTFTTGDKRSA
jgi:DNA primase